MGYCYQPCIVWVCAELSTPVSRIAADSIVIRFFYARCRWINIHKIYSNSYLYIWDKAIKQNISPWNWTMYRRLDIVCVCAWFWNIYIQTQNCAVFNVTDWMTSQLKLSIVNSHWIAGKALIHSWTKKQRWYLWRQLKVTVSITSSGHPTPTKMLTTNSAGYEIFVKYVLSLTFVRFCFLYLHLASVRIAFQVRPGIAASTFPCLLQSGMLR